MKITSTVWIIWSVELVILLLGTMVCYVASSEGMISFANSLLLYIIIMLIISVIDANLLGRKGLIHKFSE